MNENFKKSLQVNKKEEDEGNRVFAAMVESAYKRKDSKPVAEPVKEQRNEFIKRMAVTPEVTLKKLSNEEREEAGKRAAAAMIMSAEERAREARRKINKQEENEDIR